jgi:AAA15 family ATPase/GTPase
MIKIDKIQLNNFRFFTNDKNHNTFDIDGKNMLLYGENGSGKSSLFKAFDFLAQTKIDKEVFFEFGYNFH